MTLSEGIGRSVPLLTAGILSESQVVDLLVALCTLARAEGAQVGASTVDSAVEAALVIWTARQP